MKSENSVIEVNGIGKRYYLGHNSADDNFRATLAAWAKSLLRGKNRALEGTEFWALQDIDFSVKAGEVLGIIGRNGAGKSTLLKILSRITEPTTGEARLRGRVASLLEVGVGFHPELTGRENIYLNGSIIGMKRSEIDRQFDAIVDFAEIEKFLDTPVKRYSSGMYVRLAFAVAAHLQPEILLIDEVLAVGDVAFQKKCLGRMNDVATREGRTVLFVSHNMSALKSLCSRGIVLSDGRATFDGPAGEAVDFYLSQFKEDGMLSAFAEPDKRQGSGRLRFTSVKVTSDKGEKPAYATGDNLVIEFAYKAESDLNNVSLSLPVYTAEGLTVFNLYSRLAGQDFDSIPREGVFTVKVPRLQLRKGSYMFNIWADIGGVLADWVQEAATFDVENGDYFSLGHPQPANTIGLVVVPHEFSVREA